MSKTAEAPVATMQGLRRIPICRPPPMRRGMGQCLCRAEDGLSIRRAHDSPGPERR